MQSKERRVVVSRSLFQLRPNFSIGGQESGFNSWTSCRLAPTSKPNTVQVNIQTNAFFSNDLRRNAEYHHEQTLCHSMHNSKVLPMQPLDVVQDVIWRSYVSLKFGKRLNIQRSYSRYKVPQKSSWRPISSRSSGELPSSPATQHRWSLIMCKISARRLFRR